MKITLLRDSVCASDDCTAPNDIQIEYEDSALIMDILEIILKNNYLPTIDGGKATWSVSITQPVAVIAQEWNEPKLLCLSQYPFYNTQGYIKIEKIYFNYHGQDDPDVVYNVLKRYKHGQ